METKFKITDYNNLREKNVFFGGENHIINTKVEEVFKHFESLKKNKIELIFRGCSEAKYKLFNSAQRYYSNQQLYLHADNVNLHYAKFITDLITESKKWNKKTINKLLKANNIKEDNTLAYLSYMQHYGVPTPLLDFSTDPYIALYFAIENINYYSSSNEINNYFSLYFYNPLSSILKLMNTFFEQKKRDVNILNYAEFSENNPIYIISNKENAYKILNNTNIINQKGLFIYNNACNQPLEETYLIQAINMNEFMKGKGFDSFDFTRSFGGCYNIHKSFVPYIKDKLNKKGITKEYIYPNIYQMKETILHNSIINLLKK